MLNIIKQNKYKILIFILLLIVQIIRCFSGHGSSDEHFYSAIAYRMALGDKLLVDDWHIAQLMSFITSPLVKLYLLLIGSTKGIVLYFRILYVLMSLISSILINIKFKDYKYSFIASIIFFMFVPFNISSLSYNTISINFLMQALCLYGLNNKLLDILSGILFACVVLCCPYLAIFYILFLIYKLLIKKDKNTHLLYSLLGILIIFILFMINLLVNSSLKDLLTNIPYIINDKSHSSSILMNILKDGYGAYLYFNIFIYILGILCLINLFIKNKKIDILNLILVIICIAYYFIVSRSYINMGGIASLLLPINIYGFSYLNRTNNKLTIYYLVFLIHSICVCFSSNVQLRSTSNTMISGVVITLLILENIDLKEILKKILITIITIVIFINRLMFNYNEPVLNNTQIMDGPLKGLYTNNEYIDEYEKVLEDLNKINALDKDIYIVTSDSYIFLLLDNHHIINYSTYEYLDKEDSIDLTKSYLNTHNLGTYYVYIYNGYIDIDDVWDNYSEVDLKLNNGKLYIINN